MMNKLEWIIALLGADDSKPIKSITRVQYLLYHMLRRYFPEDLDQFEFEATNFPEPMRKENES